MSFKTLVINITISLLVMYLFFYLTNTPLWLDYFKANSTLLYESQKNKDIKFLNSIY